MLLTKELSPKSSYDIIVIGAGWGGLTSANILARQGLSVLLLESHNKLGGLATWFRRLPYIFDVSLHGFPYGMIKSCKKYWNTSISDLIVPLKDLRFYNPQFQLSTPYTVEDFNHKMIHHFGASKESVDRFFHEVFNYKESLESCGAFFTRHFPARPDIVRFLLEPITYANGHTLEDPAVSFCIVFGNFMRKGIYTMTGGTDHLMGLVREELLKNSVDIKLQTKVEKILVEKKQVRGVVINGQEILAPVVISNSNLKATLFDLVGEEHFSKDYSEKGHDVRLNTSSCQVYLGLKEGSPLPDLGDLCFYSEESCFNTKELLSSQTTSKTFSLYKPNLHANVPYGMIVASTNALYEDWKKLSPTEYEHKKEELIQTTLQTLEKLSPSITQEIAFKEAATPLTIESYTGHLQGAAFGTKFEGLSVSQSLAQEIQGLYHCGSVGIIMSGWLGAINYGAITANEVASFFSTKN